MRILTLRTGGLVLPAIHASMVRAFQTFKVETLDIPVPQSEEEFHSLESMGRQGFQAIFALDLGKDPSFISRLRDLQESIRIPWIIWFVDDPEGYGFPESCNPEWTIAFCWDREITQEFSLKSSGKEIPLIHLPLAADPEVFFAEEIPSTLRFPGGIFVGSTAQTNEVLEKAIRTTPGFLGDLEPLWGLYRRDLKRAPQTIAWMYLMEKTGQRLDGIQADPLCRLWVHAGVHLLGIWKRRELVSRLIGQGGGIFGDTEWAHTAGDLYQGQIPYGEELRRVYNHSAFVLDIRQPQARTGLTQRIFDASACSRPVLTEYSPELKILFGPEDELSFFANSEQALELKKNLLRHPEESNRKAMHAKNKVLSHHTYQHRAKQILQVLKQR